MHVRRAVALAREAVAEAEEASLRPPDEGGELFDFSDANAGDRARPSGIARPYVRLEFVRRIGIALEIVPVGPSVTKQNVHDGAGERSVRAWPHAQGEIGLPHRFGFIDVDSDDLRSSFLAGANRVGHHIDLSCDRVGAPD